MQYSTIQYSTVQYSAVQCSAVLVSLWTCPQNHGIIYTTPIHPPYTPFTPPTHAHSLSLFLSFRWIIFHSKALQSSLAIIPYPKNIDTTSLENGNSAGSPPTDESPVFGWGFSASKYSMESLDSTTHDFQLEEEEDGRIHVHVDSRTMGIAGYDSWTPHLSKEFQIPSGEEYQTRILLVPY